MPFVAGYLRRVRRGLHPDQGLPPGEGPVDPDYGVGEEGPDQGLPGEGDGIWGGPIMPPSNKPLPKPPPGVWPPPVSIWPPVALPPDYPMPPGSIWPPVGGLHPDQGLPGDGGSAGQLPSGGGRPVHPDQGLPSQKFLVAIVALGAGGPRVIGYTVVDPSLRPGHLPAEPPVAQPK